MKNIKLCGLLLAGFGAVYASSMPIYDQVQISSQTWEEIDLTYVNQINGKDYLEQANLLRPRSWVKQRHLDKVGATVHLTEDDFGSEVDVKVVAIKPSTVNYSNDNATSIKPVIATFIKHSDDVWSYTFSNGETIEATSNHPFYDVDKKQYIPIGEFQLNGDHLLTDDNTKAQLSSKIKHNKGVEAVYNIEVYQAHNYEVGGTGITVHNAPNCGVPVPKYAEDLIARGVIREEGGTLVMGPFSTSDELEVCTIPLKLDKLK